MSMRIGGLASGMDIDSLVSDLMKAEKLKSVSLVQDKQIIDWKREAYNEVNRTFANFIIDTKTEFGLASSTASGSLVNSSVSNLDWVKTALISDSDIADVTANASAVKGTYEINVKQLAKNWSSASSSSISTGDKDNLASQFGLNVNDTIKFTIATNKGSVDINYTDLNQVNLDDIIDKINDADIGVSAIYDSDLDRVFLQTSDTGAENTISITDNSTIAAGGSFITGNDSVLKLNYVDDNGVSQVVADNTQYTGKDSIIDFGAAKDITQSSNSLSIHNVHLSLKQTGPTTLTVDTNVDAIYKKVEDFIKQYNELINKLGQELGEKRYSDYRPLTDEQRGELTDAQIDQWEEKAKSGLLRNDEVIESSYQRIRMGMYQEVSGVSGEYNQLTQLGITTQKFSSGSVGGKLEIYDKNKLIEAIQKDPDGVIELLFKEPSQELASKSESKLSASELNQKRAESGLIRRLYDNIAGGMKNLIIKAGPGSDAELYRSVNSSILIDFVADYGSISLLDKDESEVDDRLDILYDRMDMMEDRYWRQFSAMESALQKMNQQSAWLSQQLGASSAG